MNEREVPGGEQPIARRVQQLEQYCLGGELSLEGLQEKIAGIPADAVEDSDFFHWACYSKRVTLEIVEYLIDAFPDAVRLTVRGALPIHCAALSDGQHKADIIKCLLEKDSDCASKTERSRSLPLHMACHSGRECLDSVRLLFDAYPQAVNIRDERGRTPIEVARERWSRVREFLEAQIAYDRQAEDTQAMTTPDENGWLPLHRALRNNASLGAIKLLIAGNPSSLRVADSNLAFPLHIACEFSTVGVVQLLLDHYESHFRVHCDAKKDSTLHYACRGGNLGAVKCLLERGVPSVSEPNTSGKLPIHLLWESDRVDRDSVGYVEAVRRLLLAHPETVMH